MFQVFNPVNFFYNVTWGTDSLSIRITMGMCFTLLIMCPTMSRAWTIKVTSAVGIDGEPIDGTVKYTAALSAASNIGKGNFGKVLKALDVYGNEFAIKYAKLELQDNKKPNDEHKEEAKEFLDNEFGGYQHLYKKLAKLNLPRDGFPHVVLKGLANIRKNGSLKYPVIVMGYYPQDLEVFAGLTEEKNPWEFVTPLQLVNFSTQILNILIVLKQCDIVHRDLKAANFMVDKTGRLRLVDFGFASYENSPLDPNELRGSIPYMLRSDFDTFNGPTYKGDFTALVCMMPEVVLGYKRFDKLCNAIGQSAPPKDAFRYIMLGRNWRIPYIRSRYNELIGNAFEGQEPAFLPELQKTVLSMYTSTESPEEVDYSLYYNQLEQLLKGITTAK